MIESQPCKLRSASMFRFNLKTNEVIEKPTQQEHNSLGSWGLGVDMWPIQRTESSTHLSLDSIFDSKRSVCTHPSELTHNQPATAAEG